MFIDGDSSSKQRQNSAPLRPTDTNSNPTTSTSRRKSRKPTKSLQDNENKTLQIDEDTQSISFIDDDDHTTTTTTTTTHSLNEQICLPNDDDDEESHSNTTVSFISHSFFIERKSQVNLIYIGVLFKDISKRIHFLI
jgi:hypothetical protein